MHAPTANLLTSDLPEIAADTLARVRATRPLVHCITNAVAQNFTANVLLAVGAVPSMTIAPDEVAEFVGCADALLINLGTFDPERREAADMAAAKAAAERRPWVLDPALVDRSQQRATFAKLLAARKPSAVRLNDAEFTALAATAPTIAALERYALDRRCVMALTGATDVLTDGSRVCRIANGDPMMGRVTAMGCAGAAVVAAFLAMEADSWTATAAALLVFAIAGECAAARARGPGSFAVEMLDALAGLERETLCARARLE
jgi:hydroxyethylthiazole kinase